MEPIEKKYSECDMFFLIPEIESEIELNMDFDDLIIWNDMKNDVTSFLNIHVKK